jgi:hypothetical protein
VGIFSREAKVVKVVAELFEGDWAKTDLGQKEAKAAEKGEKSDKAEKGDKELVAQAG